MAENDGNRWRHGLFGCFHDIKWTIITLFLPCYPLYKIGIAIGRKWIAVLTIMLLCLAYLSTSSVRVPFAVNDHNVATKLILSGLFCISTLLFVTYIGLRLFMRIRIKKMQKIEGSIFHDLLVVSCCGPCAICQEIQEADILDQERIK